MSELVFEIEHSLRKSIESLYYIFSSYSSKSHMEACPCCVREDEKKEIKRKPIRELNANNLKSYAFKALTTWGNEDNFKYFLPRLFELQAFERFEFSSPEVLFGKLEYADWWTWPVQEQQVIKTYFKLLWKFVLVVIEPTPFGTEIGNYLCGIGQAIDNLNPYLVLWQQNDMLNAQTNFIAFIQENIDELIYENKLVNSYWENRERQMKQVVRWLLDTQTHTIFLNSSIIQTNEVLANKLKNTIKQLPKFK